MAEAGSRHRQLRQDSGCAPLTRPFGSGRPVSLFTLGTMRALESPQQMASVLEAALDAGIRHLETAPAYGPAEAFLGAALRDLETRDPVRRRDLVLTSKLLPGLSPEQGREQLRAMLTRLASPRLDNLAVHGLNTPEHLDWALAGDGRELLAWALGEGLVGQVGFSSHGSTSLIERALASGRFGFCSLHLHLFDQERLPLARAALAAGLGVLAISPADKGGRLYDPPPDLLTDCAPFHPLELAYRFLLDQGISTLSLGAARPEDLAWAARLGRGPAAVGAGSRGGRSGSVASGLLPAATGADPLSSAGPEGSSRGPSLPPGASLAAPALRAPASQGGPGAGHAGPRGSQGSAAELPSSGGPASALLGGTPPVPEPAGPGTPCGDPRAAALTPSSAPSLCGAAFSGPASEILPAGVGSDVPAPAPGWLDAEHRAALARLDVAGRQRLGDGQCGQCRQCLPCPREVPIPALLRLRNLAVGHGMVPFASERYSLIGRAGHWWEQLDASACERCGDCLPRCPLQLPIPDLLADTHGRLAAPPRRRLWG